MNDFFKDILQRYPNSEVVQQREREIIDLYLSRYSMYRRNLFRIDGTLYGAELYESLKKSRRVRAFSNIYDWIGYCGSFELFISDRFHGTVASLYSGTPSIIIPIDSRMDELVRYHNLPHIFMDQVKQTKKIEDLISEVDLNSYLSVVGENRDRFFSFLESNSLPHIVTSEAKSFNYAYKSQEEKYFDELRLSEKVFRALRYYCGRVWEKIEWGINPIWKN